MKTLIVGAGPAGLSFAALTAAADHCQDITVMERNAEDQTPGWGITLRDHALALLGLEKRVAFQELEGREFWYRAELIVNLPCPHGSALVTMPRTALIKALIDCCRERGVGVRYEVDAASLSDSELATYDLVVAADGASSGLRKRAAGVFKPTVSPGRNRYAWLGAAVPFRKLTILLRDQGVPLLAWAYRYTPDRSTFIVECTERTWESNFADHVLRQAGTTITKAFETELAGQAVLAGSSMPWQRHQTISCERLHHRNLVLVGDAAHTTHFSQGFGTMFAFDDAVSLHTALKESASVEQALWAYEAQQRPKIAAFQSIATTSMRWGERLLDRAEDGDAGAVRALIAARWPNNEVMPSPLAPPTAALGRQPL